MVGREEERPTAVTAGRRLRSVTPVQRGFLARIPDEGKDTSGRTGTPEWRPECGLQSMQRCPFLSSDGGTREREVYAVRGLWGGGTGDHSELPSQFSVNL